MIHCYIALLIEPTDRLHQLYTLFVESQKDKIPLTNIIKQKYYIHFSNKPSSNFYKSFMPTNNIRLCGPINNINDLHTLLIQCLINFLQYEPILPETFILEFTDECRRLINQVPFNNLAYQEPPKGIK
jgi:hypothetical protein